MKPSRDPLPLLQDAHARAAAGDWDGAARRMRECLGLRPDYTFHVRSRGLVEQILVHSRPARRIRIAVLGGATTSLLLPVLRALGFRDGFDAEFYEGVFGAYRQEILSPDSGLYAFGPDITFIIPTWHDLHLGSLDDNTGDVVEQLASEHAALWRTLSASSATHIVQHAFDLPPVESAGALSAIRAGGRRHRIRRLNLRLSELATSRVSVLDTEHVMAKVGHDAWHDQALWYRARQHPSGRALPSLAEEQMAHVRASLGVSRKVVICDLDNTLWGGVIGEDGLQGIRVGEGSPEGEAHADLQIYLKELRARGVLLAVASKNNPDEARLPFVEHPGMVLRLGDFAAFEASWDDKATSIRRIAGQLSLGLDSFVVLDDNPVERAWIRDQLPEVAVVELGPSPSTFVRSLDDERLFEVLAVSPEDERRAELYRLEDERRQLRTRARSLEEFLASLEMEANVEPISPANLARATQLVNKTNQFNLTTRRYTEAQLSALAAAPGAWTGVFRLKDRFGDHGTVGLLLCVPADNRNAWEIDTWLMSCRVLGRELEGFMFDRALNAAREAGISKIVGLYRSTRSNAAVADLYERFGFSPSGEAGEERRFELTVRESAEPRPCVIKSAQPAQTEKAAR